MTTLQQLHEWVHELTHQHQAWARLVGSQREGGSRRGRYRDSYQRVSPRQSLAGHVNGAGGELAFGNVVHLHWLAGVGTGNQPDYPLQGIEVKTATHWGDRLPIRHTVWKPGRLAPYYALVWGTMPRYTVVGWLPADDLAAMLERLRPHPETFCKYVPWQWLNPLPRNGGPPWAAIGEPSPTAPPATYPTPGVNRWNQKGQL